MRVAQADVYHLYWIQQSWAWAPHRTLVVDTTTDRAWDALVARACATADRALARDFDQAVLTLRVTPARGAEHVALRKRQRQLRAFGEGPPGVAQRLIELQADGGARHAA